MKHNNCLSPEQIIEYIAGRLQEDRKEDIENHMAECDNCREDFIVANMLIQEKDDPVPEIEIHGKKDKMKLFKKIIRGLGDTAKKIIEWATDISPPLWLPQLQPQMVRSTRMQLPQDASPSSADSIYTEWKMDDLIMSVYLKKLGEKEKRDLLIRIKPFIKGKAVCNTRISLGKKDSSPAGKILKRENDFFEKRLSFGVYKLNVTHEGKDKGQRIFEINKEGMNENEQGALS